MRATYKGKAGVVEVLVDRGADINLKSYSGGTALCIATGNGRTEIAAYLESKGAKM